MSDKVMFTIATEREHSESVIQREGSYGTGDFPPLFYTKEAAERYLHSLPFQSNKEVIEMPIGKDHQCPNCGEPATVLYNAMDFTSSGQPRGERFTVCDGCASKDALRPVRLEAGDE